MKCSSLVVEGDVSARTALEEVWISTTDPEMTTDSWKGASLLRATFCRLCLTLDCQSARSPIQYFSFASAGSIFPLEVCIRLLKACVRPILVFTGVQPNNEKECIPSRKHSTCDSFTRKLLRQQYYPGGPQRVEFFALPSLKNRRKWPILYWCTTSLLKTSPQTQGFLWRDIDKVCKSLEPRLSVAKLHFRLDSLAFV